MHFKKLFCLTVLSALVCFHFHVYAADPISMEIVSSELGQVVVEIDRALPQSGNAQAEQWYLLENGQKANITKWERKSGEAGLNAVLVFDHSSGWAGTPFTWASVKRSISKLIDGFDAERDSVALIGYSEAVDMNTDLTDNLEVLKMILNGSEEAPGQAMAQAMQSAAEALGPHQGNQAIFIVSSGYSERSLGEVLRNINVPVYVLAPGYKEDWAYFSWESGGMYEDLASLMNGSLKASDLRTWPSATTEITYVSTLGKDALRKIEIFAPSLQTEGPLAITNTAVNVMTAASKDIGNSAPEKNKSNWFLFAIPIIIGLAGLIYLIRFLRFRTSKGTVLPGITNLTYNAKKHVLLAQVNIPIRTKPAKFTLHNHSGTPVRDQIISGTTRKVKMDLKGLSEGIYKCSLSNAGMTSEQQEIVLG
ncbi:MAG: VWA domain-containing protein [Bacteroidia bacterium]